MEHYYFFNLKTYLFKILFICDCCKSDISKMLNVSDETSCMHSTASLQTDSVHYNENNNATREKIKKRISDISIRK